MSLEGELRIGLRLRRGRVERVGIGSTRPDVAQALLLGRTRAQVAATVPVLFSICGRSQSVASALACAAAAGEPIPPQTLASSSAAVAAETVRETAWRTLLDWPQWLGESPAEGAVTAARGSLAMGLDDAGSTHGAGAQPLREVLSQATFGAAAVDWLALDTLAELDRWLDAGTNATARFMRRVRDEDAAQAAADGAWGPDRAMAPSLLRGRDDADWLTDIDGWLRADPAYSRHPSWRGAPAETGALARQQCDPLTKQLLARSASRVPARFFARLREFAGLLAGHGTAALGARALPAGGGMAWVENSRGLLLHLVQFDGERLCRCSIVAPTEWNFHPGGALATGLVGAAAADREALRSRCTRLLHSLDPCVACRVEFDDA